MEEVNMRETRSVPWHFWKAKMFRAVFSHQNGIHKVETLKQDYGLHYIPIDMLQYTISHILTFSLINYEDIL